MRSYLDTDNPLKRLEIGSEPTPEPYVEHLVAVFREVWRVLRRDGTVWLNLGDSYAGSTMSGGSQETRVGGGTKRINQICGSVKSQRVPCGLKPKDLVGIPWRVAFALQANGWWLRSAIPWLKKNAMPESVRDRLTTAHEYWFLLTKSKRYYWDADAVRKETTDPEYRTRGKIRPTKDPMWADSTQGDNRGGLHNQSGGRTSRNRRTSDAFFDSLDVLIDEQHQYLAHLEHIRDKGGFLLDEGGDPLALVVNTASFAGAHFATFPPKLVEPMILAGTSAKGACPRCGAAWKRVVVKTGHVNKRETAHAPNNCPTKTDSTGWAPTTAATNNWQPTCTCDAGNPTPCLVLDPFAGTSTVGQVCIQHRRSFVGLELNRAYIALAQERTSGVQVRMKL